MGRNLIAAIGTTALITALASPFQLPAQHTRYKLVDLGPFSGLAVPGRPLNIEPLPGNGQWLNLKLLPNRARQFELKTCFLAV